MNHSTAKPATTNKGPSQSQRLTELDALRGLAAISVVLYHYLFRYQEIYGLDYGYSPYAYFGQYGVHFFFIISGFVIHWSLDRTKSPTDFVVSRLSRLYPVYWACVFLTFSAVAILGLEGRQVSLGHAVTNALMFHEYLRIPHVDGVYWTLTLELQFYCFIFALYLIGQLRNSEIWFSILVVASAINAVGSDFLPSIIAKVFMLKFSMYFTIGLCAFKKYNREFGVATGCCLAVAITSVWFVFSIGEFVLTLLFAGLFFSIVDGKARFLRTKWLGFLGGISYPLYLLHQNIGYALLNLGHDNDIAAYIAVPLIVVAVMIISSFMHFAIELPAMNYIRRWYRAKPMAPKPA